MSVLSTDPPNNDSTAPILNPVLVRVLRVVFLSAITVMIVATIGALPQLYQLMYDGLSGNFSTSLWKVVYSSFPDGRVNPLDYGFSLEFFTTLYTFPFFFEPLGFFLVGAYIFYRRSDDRMTLLTAALLIIVGIFLSPALGVLLSQPVGEALLRFTLTIIGLLTACFQLLFPNGKFVPSWTRWLLPIAFIVNVIVWWEIGINFTGGMFLFLLCLGCLGMPLAHRYLFRFTPLQRQQTKWLLFGWSISFAFNLAIVIYKPLVAQLGGNYFFTYQLVVFPILWFGAWFILLISTAFSILRYGLWNVDLVINRSVVYITLTAVLGVLFFGIILLLQAILERVLGSQQTTIATIAATLVVFAVFNPARKLLQRFVDRRIYGLRAELSEVVAAQKKPDVKNPGMYTGRTFGKYEILGVLGKGGMGEVYKGFGEGQTAAIKVLPPDLAIKEESRKRFAREAQTLAGLQHPNIVKLFASGVSDDGVHYLAMEYIDGQELSVLVQAGALKEYDSLYDWVETIATALDYIHSKNLVHRDLKPSNIMLRAAPDKETRAAVLMDFGIARVDATGTRLTGSGGIGTIDYMSPEQILAAREVDKRSDIYALGIIVYELLTGELPFKGSAGQVLFAHLQKPAPDPRNLYPDVPRHIAKAVLQALEKDPDARYSTAGEFAAALTTQEALST